MRQRERLRSRAGGRSHLVRSERLAELGADAWAHVEGESATCHLARLRIACSGRSSREEGTFHPHRAGSAVDALVSGLVGSRPPMGVVRYLAPDTDAYVASVQRHAGEFEAESGHRLEARILPSD